MFVVSTAAGSGQDTSVDPPAVVASSLAQAEVEVLLRKVRDGSKSRASGKVVGRLVEQRALERASGREGDAGTAVALVLDRGDVVLAIDVGQVPGREAGELETASLLLLLAPGGGQLAGTRETLETVRVVAGEAGDRIGKSVKHAKNSRPVGGSLAGHRQKTDRWPRPRTACGIQMVFVADRGTMTR